ncbi:MAG: response regulator [Myxococcales bacterium]|jgi:CheY-like chemotaxis protein
MSAETRSSGPVMLVEDDADIRNMVGMLLELEGYQVVATSNGDDALKMLRDGERPCVILLDLMMPVMNGWQFLAEQARDPAIAPIPVVVMSGDARGIEKPATVRAAGYLKKPIDLQTLLNTVQRFACA